MIHKVDLFLPSDTVDHLDWIAEEMSKKRGVHVKRSGAVEWVVKRHWKKMQAQRASKAPVEPLRKVG